MVTTAARQRTERNAKTKEVDRCGQVGADDEIEGCVDANKNNDHHHHNHNQGETAGAAAAAASSAGVPCASLCLPRKTAKAGKRNVSPAKKPRQTKKPRKTNKPRSALFPYEMVEQYNARIQECMGNKNPKHVKSDGRYEYHRHPSHNNREMWARKDLANPDKEPTLWKELDKGWKECLNLTMYTRYHVEAFRQVLAGELKDPHGKHNAKTNKDGFLSVSCKQFLMSGKNWSFVKTFWDSTDKQNVVNRWEASKKQTKAGQSPTEKIGEGFAKFAEAHASNHGSGSSSHSVERTIMFVRKINDCNKKVSLFFSDFNEESSTGRQVLQAASKKATDREGVFRPGSELVRRLNENTAYWMFEFMDETGKTTTAALNVDQFRGLSLARLQRMSAASCILVYVSIKEALNIEEEEEEAVEF